MASPKAVMAKSLLLRAWRERWSDMQWGINIKKVLTAGVTGDALNLSELILQQAMVGSTPNALVLSYLKHALSSQVVSYAGTISSIIMHEDIGKPYCIKSLLELVESFAGRLGTCGNSEDSLNLSKAVLHLLKWILHCMHKSVQRLQDGKQLAEYAAIITKACDVFLTIMASTHTQALVYVARADELETFRQIEQLEANVRGTVTSLSPAIQNAFKDKLDAALKTLSSIQMYPVQGQGLLDISGYPLAMSVNILVALEAALNPTNDVQPFVDQLITIEKMQNLSRPNLYCELFRVRFMGMIDANGGPEELKWAAFTFLKLPQVVKKLVQCSADEEEAIKFLETGIEQLLTFTPLLDLMDITCHCDCVQFLLKEICNKFNLISESQYEKYITQRSSAFHRQTEAQKNKPPESSTQASACLILRAERTVNSVLKTLDADYSKNQDALLGVLCQMTSGKSFELVLAAAAATGKLQSFAIKLIKFNEFAKQINGEGSKAAQTRALVFDITFLMLCHITQMFGTEIISSSVDSSDSFFSLWALRCLPEDGKYKSLESSLPADQAKVDMLLQQFNVGGELKTSLTRWHEVCSNAPYSIMEVLHAWEQGAIAQEQVKAILDNVKSWMCCLPVVISAYVCSYINSVGEDERKKPLTMIQQLILPLPPESTRSYYNERSQLMGTVLKKMIQEVLPASSTAPRIQPQYLHPKRLAHELFTETYQDIFNKGCINLKSVHIFEQLLSIGGTEWFTDRAVQELLSFTRPEEVTQAVCLTSTLFHMDLEPLVLTLLLHTVPNRLLGNQMDQLSDPRGCGLAQLCILAVVMLHTSKQSQHDTSTNILKRSRKRSRRDIELEDMDENSSEGKPNKMRRLHEEELTLHSEGFNLDFISVKVEADAIPAYDTKDPLNKALLNLFRLFSTIYSSSMVSQRNGFIISFMKMAVKIGGPHSKFILQFMPMNMAAQLMKCPPGHFDTKFLLAISDLTSTRGRRMATKVISQNGRFSQLKRLS